MENKYSMKGYIDIHSHILPGMDDGAKNMEQTMAMLWLAVQNQIGTIICTPHFKDGREYVGARLEDRLSRVRSRCREEGLLIELHSGCELFYTASVCELLEQKKIPTLASSDCVLVEFSPWEQFTTMQEGLFSIKACGYRPVLAHAERYECLRDKKERIITLRDMDVLVQVNAGSILEVNDTGKNFRGSILRVRGKNLFGNGDKKYVRYLLDNRLIDFVATDSHSDGKRGPYLNACAEYLKKKYGETYSSALLGENARTEIFALK